MDQYSRQSWIDKVVHKLWLSGYDVLDIDYRDGETVLEIRKKDSYVTHSYSIPDMVISDVGISVINLVDHISSINLI